MIFERCVVLFGLELEAEWALVVILTPSCRLKSDRRTEFFCINDALSENVLRNVALARRVGAPASNIYSSMNTEY